MPGKTPERLDLTGSGEFVTDELERSQVGDNTQRRRRRRSSKHKKKPPSNQWATFAAFGVLGICLTFFGVLLGMNFRPAESESDRVQAAIQAMEAARENWLSECTDAGHTPWTCQRFDRVHFEKAKKLDTFRCDEADGGRYDCLYKLGAAEVVLRLSDIQQINGEYLAPRKPALAIISHSRRDDDYFVAVSEKGHVEIRQQDGTEPLFVINPATGSMNALHDGLVPDR